jgi:hypothetical protein
VDIGKLSPNDGRIVAEVQRFTSNKYYYFVATAYNSAGLESDYSTQVELFLAALGDTPNPIIRNIALNAILWDLQRRKKCF